MSETRTLAVFDFDNTLIGGDSLWPFLIFVAGRSRAYLALLEAGLAFSIRYVINKKNPALADPRTFIKLYLLQRLLAGRKLGSFGEAIEQLRQWCVWNEDVRSELNDHAARGHKIVIASGGLNLYLPELLKDLPSHTLICTTVKVTNGVVAGEVASDNCVRIWKGRMLADFMAQNDPYEDSWGYGNFPHDIPMLNMLKHRVIIS